MSRRQKAAYMRRWRKANRPRLRQYWRDWRRRMERAWWTRAVLKAKWLPLLPL